MTVISTISPTGTMLTEPWIRTWPPAAFRVNASFGFRMLPSMMPLKSTAPSFFNAGASMPANFSSREASLALSRSFSSLTAGSNASPSSWPLNVAVAPAALRLRSRFGANRLPSIRPFRVTEPRPLGTASVSMPANLSNLGTSSALTSKASPLAVGTPPSPSTTPFSETEVPAILAISRRRISIRPL